MCFEGNEWQKIEAGQNLSFFLFSKDFQKYFQQITGKVLLLILVFLI